MRCRRHAKCCSWLELEEVLLLLFCSSWRWFCSFSCCVRAGAGYAPPPPAAQVYAPVDDNPEAFHRSLSLFICPDGDKLAQAGTGGLGVAELWEAGGEGVAEVQHERWVACWRWEVLPAPWRPAQYKWGDRWTVLRGELDAAVHALRCHSHAPTSATLPSSPHLPACSLAAVMQYARCGASCRAPTASTLQSRLRRRMCARRSCQVRRALWSGGVMPSLGCWSGGHMLGTHVLNR